MKLFEYRDHHVVVASFGNQIEYDPATGDFSQATQEVESLARGMGAENVLLQLVANDRRGRFVVLPRNYIGRAHNQFVTIDRDRLDGVVLTCPGDAVAFMTRDCPTLVLYCTKQRGFAVLHIWRNSVQGFDIHKPRESVIRNALWIFQSTWKVLNPETIRGVVTMGISALHFHNERYPGVIECLRREWGERAAPRNLDLFSPIDLFEVIVAQLEMYGIKREQVVHDGLDTFSDPRLASKRAGKNERHNLVIVHYKKKEKPNPRREHL